MAVPIVVVVIGSYAITRNQLRLTSIATPGGKMTLPFEEDSAFPWFDEEMIIYPDLVDAFIGISWQFTNGPLATYDREKVLEIFMDRDGMSADEAAEFFEINTQSLWVGERTPVFVTFTDRG